MFEPLNRVNGELGRADAGGVLDALVASFNALLLKLDADTNLDDNDYATTLWVGSGCPNSDAEAPTLTSAVVGADGLTLTLIFSESTLVSAGGDYSGFVLHVGEGTVDLSGPVRTNNVLVFACSEAIEDGATCTLDYSGDDIKDMAGNALAAISDEPVTNSSEVSGT